MALDPDLKELFSAKAIHRPVVSRDEYNRAVHGDGTEYDAKIEEEIRPVPRGNGTQMSQTQVFLYGAPVVGTDDEIETEGKRYRALAATREWDEDGPHHTVVYL